MSVKGILEKYGVETIISDADGKIMNDLKIAHSTGIFDGMNIEQKKEKMTKRFLAMNEKFVIKNYENFDKNFKVEESGIQFPKSAIEIIMLTAGKEKDAEEKVKFIVRKKMMLTTPHV